MENRQAAEGAEKVAIAIEQPRYNTDYKGLLTILGPNGPRVVAMRRGGSDAAVSARPA